MLRQPPPTSPDVPMRFLSTRELALRGVGRQRVRRGLQDGSLLRVRRGRYLLAGCHPDIVRAARLGVRVDCVSLLALLGVFVMDHNRLHVQATNGASRLPPRPPDVVCHWRPSSAEPTHLMTDVVEALAQACRCQGPREAIATLDSAWYRGIVDEKGVAAVFALLPRRFQRLRPLVDPRCESGPETIMRLLLRGLGCTVEIQVSISGVGRVDLVVDGWLIIECDSEAHHAGWEAHKRDRRRDLAAAALGYTTVRPIAEDILYRREQVLAQLKQILAVGPTTPRAQLLTHVPAR
ncbi:endonuclease domain-containing protein [Microbacterium sp. zg.Y909]|uniref:endonuclease domain-containing protein n=1 Tax=Microbacterium sp. zg.Y909 TaxID=2969413 RepID=UPI00214CEE8B|nr:DUF559 domain-containing protein [Microbacterium sp. zg.Y909]MCR2825661.1 DUF559 domain-containing protein [Microbacterium sp. zg.Y909]